MDENINKTNYFSIKTRTDKEVGNVFPQASSINQNLSHSIKFDEFRDFDSALLFELEPGAKLTDVLSQAAISAHGLLINEKVRELLSGFSIIRHRYYKCEVMDLKGNIHPYYWLHLVDDFKDKLDYSKSTFYWTHCTFREGLINLESYSDYLKQKEQNGLLWGVKIDRISLIDFPTLDLFSGIPFDLGIYISSHLKEELKNRGITGVEVNESQKFI